MSKNVSNFLSKLDKLTEKTIQVFVPSLKKKVPVKPLNLKQQKDLISSVLDGLKGTLDFSKTLNTIILDNSGIGDLRLYDKLPFIIAMRKDALGSKVGDIELQQVTNNVKSIPFDIKDSKTIKHDNLKINLKIPTLRQENILLSKCEQDISAEDDQLKEGVGLLYLFELVKYIDSLEIDDDILEMSEIRINERIKLVEKLPLHVYTEMSEFIEAINRYNNDILTVGEFELSIDSEFFDTSSTD